MTAMAKRRMIIAAIFVLLATTFSLSSGVFAKYISNRDVKTNQATVARWGFSVSTDASEFFGTEYQGEGLATDLGEGSLRVGAQEGLEEIFPGTTGSMKISFRGTSEVRAKLTVDISGEEICLKKDGETYYPIVWTLTKGSATLASGRLSDINAYFEDNAETPEVNELEILPNTHSAFEGEYVLTWVWDLHNDDSNISDLSVNAADTRLGYAAVPEEDRTAEQTEALNGYTAETTLSVSVLIMIEQLP